MSSKSDSMHKTLSHKAPLVESYLLDGRLAEGENALLKHLEHHRNDDQARFGLGVLQFLRAVEKLAQDLYKFGLLGPSEGRMLGPITRLPVPKNPNPEIISYQQLRVIVDTFRAGLLKAEATLIPIKQEDVKLPLHFKIIKLDLNGDGVCEEDERLWMVYASVTNAESLSSRRRNSNKDSRQSNDERPEDFLICFDRGDVHWLRGYCNLLAAVCEIYLAYDSRETFEHTAHMFFENVDSPYKCLKSFSHLHNLGDSDLDALDLIAMIHSIDWPITEPKRMENALHHLELVVTQSHETWRWIMSETDDDHEWLPNPNQTGVIPNVRVTQEMVDSWNELMLENGKILSGELLVPFWRGDKQRGINLRKVFLQPSRLDLVYWVQGTGMEQYLEHGKLTQPPSWRRWQNSFGQSFPGFAIYFN